ncbi:hypothetical protein NDU88_001159 [Pleurodeles waltl]|uniref:Uncharacterized protein n=1 Tax=Pleurodeles waltl TaxID=8319 RepID=A0AAV7R9F6_PLEWA|nr:hypothetical protein NDU88_001159 [Pleurodeles waltl]
MAEAAPQSPGVRQATNINTHVADTLWRLTAPHLSVPEFHPGTLLHIVAPAETLQVQTRKTVIANCLVIAEEQLIA